MKSEKLKIKSQKLRIGNKIFFVKFFIATFFLILFSGINFMFFVSPVNAAGINNQINFQGKLVNPDGTNVADSTYTVVFSLYNVSSGGTNIWTESDSVTTSAGVFQVALGANTAFPGNVDFNNPNLYLGIKVGTDAEMTPRIRFSAVPYAFNAAALDDVVATESATGFSMQGGTSSLSTLSFTTAGGALTFQPGVAEGLTIQSNGANGLTLDTGGGAAINIGNTNATSVAFGNTGHNPTYTFNGTGLTTLGGGLTVDGSTLSLANASSSTIQTTSANTGLTLLSNGSGNITLGQNAGNGNIVLQPNAGGQAALIIKDQGSGDLLTASAGGTTRFTVANNGNVTDSTATAVNFSSAALTVASCAGCTSTLAFTNITGGTNTAAAMLVGSGASLNFTGTGTINASTLLSNTWAAPGTIGGTTPGAATFTTATINNTGNALVLAGAGATIQFSGLGNAQITTASNENLSLMPGGTGKVGINATTPLATLDVRANTGSTPVASISGNTAFSNLVVDQSGTGDLFTASKSGLTKFVIDNNGNIGFAGTNNVLSTLASAATSAVTWTLPNATGTFCINTDNCGYALGTNEWQQINGAISPTTITDDMLLGGTATTSARFAFINDIGAGTPTASISANSAANATYLTGTGILATTNAQSLTLGAASTGNVMINPGGGTAELTAYDNGTVGIGTTTSTLATFDVRGSSATTSIASVSGATTFAGFVVNNSGSGDLFTASSAGKTKFTVTNSGSVFIGGDMISASSSGATNNGSPDFINALGDEGSLIPNAGFEASTSAGLGFADGWVKGATSSGALSVDSTTASQGNNSLRVNLGAGGAVAVYSSCIPLSASVQTYDLGMDTKLASTTNIPTVRAYIVGYTSKNNCVSNNTAVLSSAIGGSLTTTNTNWQTLNNFTSTALATTGETWGRLQISFQSATAATLNIDGVKLAPSAVGNGLDYAEDYPADPNNTPQPGQVVSLESSGSAALVAPSDTYMDQSAIGVVSTNPGQILDDGSMTNPVPIALAGRVPVNVSTANGLIQVGDYLTSSNIPGVAVKATGAGPVIGTAMTEDTDPNNSDVSQVTMFIKNTYYNGGTETATDGLNILSGVEDPSVLLNILQDVQTASSSSLASLSSGQTAAGLQYIVSALTNAASQSAAVTEQEVATPSAYGTLVTPTISGLTVNGSATVSADLHVQGDALVEGILHIADTLFANNFIANGVSDFFGNVIFHSGVTFNDAPVFDSDTAGFAIIKKGSDHVDVTFTKSYDNTPIINASITLNPITPSPSETLTEQQTQETQLENAALNNIHYIIINRTTKGFTILLQDPTSEDISFSWVALAVNSPMIFQSDGQNVQLPSPTQEVSPSPIDTIIPTSIPVSPVLSPTEADFPTPTPGG